MEKERERMRAWEREKEERERERRDDMANRKGRKGIPIRHSKILKKKKNGVKSPNCLKKSCFLQV